MRFHREVLGVCMAFLMVCGFSNAQQEEDQSAYIEKMKKHAAELRKNADRFDKRGEQEPADKAYMFLDFAKGLRMNAELYEKLACAIADNDQKIRDDCTESIKLVEEKLDKMYEQLGVKPSKQGVGKAETQRKGETGGTVPIRSMEELTGWLDGDKEKGK